MLLGMENRSFTIAKRYCGPEDSANGGYAAGSMAKRVDFNPVRVTLLKPPPLETNLTVQDGERGVVACTDDGTVIAACSPGKVTIEVPPIPTLEDAREATARYVMAQKHYFPECFVCGTKRPDDGLCIHPGKVIGSEIVATVWTPDASLPSENGILNSEIVWSALDCPSGTACLSKELRPIVLGKLCVEIRQDVPSGEELIVIGWSVSNDGIKQFVGSAIANADGEVLAVAEATWIELDKSNSSFAVR
jgi:hypothetical protein